MSCLGVTGSTGGRAAQFAWAGQCDAKRAGKTPPAGFVLTALAQLPGTSLKEIDSPQPQASATLGLLNLKPLSKSDTS